MKTQNILECESNQLEKLRFLPYAYKPIGFIALALSIAGLGIIYFMKVEAMLIKEVLKSLLLLSMLLVSVTKEKSEDEYTLRQRAKSYILAFVITVLYAIFQPYVDYAVAFLLEPKGAVYKEYNTFVIIWFMLFIQIGFYYVLRITR